VRWWRSVWRRHLRKAFLRVCGGVEHVLEEAEREKCHRTAVNRTRRNILAAKVGAPEVWIHVVASKFNMPKSVFPPFRWRAVWKWVPQRMRHMIWRAQQPDNAGNFSNYVFFVLVVLRLTFGTTHVTNFGLFRACLVPNDCLKNWTFRRKLKLFCNSFSDFSTTAPAPLLLLAEICLVTTFLLQFQYMFCYGRLWKAVQMLTWLFKTCLGIISYADRGRQKNENRTNSLTALNIAVAILTVSYSYFTANQAKIVGTLLCCKCLTPSK